MKKIFLNLVTAAAAGWLVCASAQPAAVENIDTNAVTAPMPMTPGGESPPDFGGLPPPPSPEAIAAIQAAVSGSAPEENTVKEPVVILPTASQPATVANLESSFPVPAQASGTNNPDELRLNFRNAPLEMVLNYLSDAAGFIIVLNTRINGNVSVISSHPMTRDEAVDLLNSVLNKNGYAAIRNGRTLTILDKNDAKTAHIPVKSGNVPDQIPNNAEIVTQIIPIRFVAARQLVSDLTSFVSPQATVVANEEGNSIVITDTQSNIRHLAEIIRAVDDSAEAETEIRVFRLKYASPADVATELASIFPSSGSGTQSPVSFGGSSGRSSRSSFFAAMMGGGGGGSSSNDRVKKATQVTAVADARIQAVIVTAPKDLIEQISSMMNDLDVPSTRDQKVVVFHMNNGDPQQAVQVLQNMFQTSGSSRSGGSSSSQNSALMQRAQNNTSATGSTSSSGTSSFGGTGGGRTGGGGPQF
ncbi:MAG: secretin N-terminal domain-containing protein [Verrucomicrobiae bacterium]